jgi:hypothetical protein
MAQILCFSRNRSVNVEQSDDQIIRASCRLQDTRLEAYVEILVKLPDLEITKAKGEMLRASEGRVIDVSETLQKAVGVRVGPGLKKILKGLLEDSPVQKQLTFMMEECCGGVILSFTKEVLSQAPKDRATEKGFFKNMVQANPRLYNSCAAFAPGSPLVEGIEEPQ